jgi:hypothetical protein
MKHLFFLLFLVNIQVVAQPHLYYTAHPKDSILCIKTFNTILPELDLDSADIDVFICSNTFNKSMTSPACVVMLNTNQFVINIDHESFKEDKILMIIHETIHISQIYHKRLIIRKSMIIFENVAYSSSISYNDRLYEVEAAEKTNEIFFKHKELGRIKF